MKIKEFKNKIVLAELDPEADYIMLVNPDYVRFEDLKHLQVQRGHKVYILPVYDIEKAVKFVEIPHKPLGVSKENSKTQKDITQ